MKQMMTRLMIVFQICVTYVSLSKKIRVKTVKTFLSIYGFSNNKKHVLLNAPIICRSSAMKLYEHIQANNKD